MCVRVFRIICCIRMLVENMFIIIPSFKQSVINKLLVLMPKTTNTRL